MATDYTVGIRFTGNSSSLNAAARDAAAGEREVGAAGQAAGNAATASFGKTRRGLESISTQLDRTKQQFLAFVGAQQLVQVGRGVARLADEYANIGAQMRQASGDSVSFGAAQEAAYGIAQRTSSSLATTADLASKLSRSLRGMGVDGATAFERAASLTESIQQAIALSHVSADAGNAAVTQLTQGLASGVLRGDELNSVLEQTPRLAQAIADGMGVTIGQLRALGAEGKITAQTVIDALSGQAGVLRTEFADLPLTIERSWTMLRNAVERYVGQADQASGASRLIASSIAAIADHIDTLVLGIEAIGAAAVLHLGGKAVAATAEYGRNLTDVTRASLQAVAAERASAAAALAAAQARSVETAATLEAVTQTRANTLAKLAQAQADIAFSERHLAAAKAAGVLSFAMREQRLAADNLSAAHVRQSAALSELALLGRQQAGLQTTLAAAASAQVAAQTRVAGAVTATGLAMRGLQSVGSGLLSLFGGWPGVVLAAAAAVVYLATRQTEAEQTAAKLDETTRSLADAHGQVTQAALAAAAAQLEEQRANLSATEAKLKAMAATRDATGGNEAMAFSAARAADAVIVLRGAVADLGEQYDRSRVAAAFQADADRQAAAARNETQGFDQLRTALKEQNAELEKQVATYGKGKVAQLEYAKSLAIATEQAKGDNNVTKARIATLENLYAPLLENARHLDAMTAASKRSTASTRVDTTAKRAAADAARDLARANADIVSSQATLEEQNQQLRDKLAGLTDQQIEYNAGVRDAVAAYQQWVRQGVPVAQAMQSLQGRYDTLNDRLQLKNQLDAADIKNTPDKVKSYETTTSAAERYYQVIEQGAKTAADTIGNYFVRNVRSIKDLWSGLVDAGKSVVAQIISTWLQLRVLQPLLAGVFGGGWMGMVGPMMGMVGGQSTGSAGVSDGAAANAPNGGAGGSTNYAGMLSNISSARSAYQWASTGGIWGSYGAGAGNVANVGVHGMSYGLNGVSGGTAVAANPFAAAPYSPAGGTFGIGGYAAPVASIGGGLLGAYYGSQRGGGGFSTVASTVSYGALGAGIAGTAAGVAGGASLGAAAGGAFGAAAGMSWIPVVGWVLAAMALVDMVSGGKLFGTKYRTAASDATLRIGAEGGEASASLYQTKQSALFGGRKTRVVQQAVPQEMQDAADALYNSIAKSMVQGAQKLGVDVPAMIEASLNTHTTYNDKGQVRATEYVVDYLGRTWKEATAEAAAQRIGAEALVATVAASAGAVAQTIAEQWRKSADTLLDGAQTMLAAQVDINKGNSLIALGATATLSQVIKFVQSMQADGEKLADTYARVAAASAQYVQFVAQFAPVSAGFGASLQAINKQMQANLDQANALAQAAGMQHAAESDLANIHQFAAKQAADAIMQLSAAAQDLAAKLYNVTTNTLASVTAQIDKLQAKVQTAAQLAIGDKSPLSGKEKLDVALQGLRSGITSADDVLALGRKLYSSSADYASLFAKVSEILQLPGATGQQSLTDAMTGYNALIGQRDQLAAQAAATQRFGDAKTLAQYVADISTTHGISYGEAASGLGFSLQDLAKDLGLTNISGYLDSLEQQDVAGTTLTASANIVDAVRGIGHDIVQAILGGPLVQPGPTNTTAKQGPTEDQAALLAKLIDQVAVLIQHAESTAQSNGKMLDLDKSGRLRDVTNSTRNATV